MDLESTYAYNVLIVFLSLPLLMLLPWVVETLGHGPERAMLVAQRVFLLGFVTVVIALTVQLLGVEMSV